MATGYTHPVKDGEVTTLAEFAMNCARAFGALITMRDDAMNAPIPEEFKPDGYAVDTLARYEARLAEVRAWSDADAEVERDVAYLNAVTAWSDTNARTEIEVSRYRAMLDQVRSWEPPTGEHVGLKDFMIEQLESSIKFDGFTMSEPERLTVAEFRIREVAQAIRMVGIYRQSVQDDIDRAAQRTAWVRDLRSSLTEVAR